MNGRRGQQGDNRGRREASQPAPPFDEKKPDADLVDALAEQQAGLLCDVTDTQLRRFFGEVKDLYGRLERGGPEAWALVEPRFRMLRSKACYATGRQRSNRPLEQMLENATRRVRDEKTFRRFVLHFEATVGFHKGLSKRR